MFKGEYFSISFGKLHSDYLVMQGRLLVHTLANLMKIRVSIIKLLAFLSILTYSDLPFQRLGWGMFEPILQLSSSQLTRLSTQVVISEGPRYHFWCTTFYNARVQVLQKMGFCPLGKQGSLPISPSFNCQDTNFTQSGERTHLSASI